MTSVSKGKNAELLARKLLEKQGYKIFYKSIRTRFGPVDYAGLFDIVAGKYDPLTFIANKIYVQVKHPGGQYGKVQRDILEFKKHYGLPNELFQIWVKINRKKEFKVIEL